MLIVNERTGFGTGGTTTPPHVDPYLSNVLVQAPMRNGFADVVGGHAATVTGAVMSADWSAWPDDYGQSAYFDGASYIDYGAAATFNAVSWCVEMRFRIAGGGGNYQSLVSYRSASTDVSRALRVDVIGGGLWVQVCGTTIISGATFPIAPDTDHHLAVRGSGNGGHVWAAVDGTGSTFGPFDTLALANADGAYTLRLGEDHNGWTLRGFVNDFRFTGGASVEPSTYRYPPHGAHEFPPNRFA